GRKDVPIVVAERFRNQLEGFAMGCFDIPVFQRMAQSMGHGFGIAEVAHTHLFTGERRKSGPALPTRSPMARATREGYVHHPRRAQAAGVSTLVKFGSGYARCQV